MEGEYLPFDNALFWRQTTLAAILHPTGRGKPRPYTWRPTTFAAVPHPTKFSSGGFLLGFRMDHGAPHAATTPPCGRTLWLGRSRTLTSE